MIIFRILFFSLCFSPLFGQTNNTQYISRVTKSMMYFTSGDSIPMSYNGKDTAQYFFFIFEAEEDTIGLDPGLSTNGRWRAIHLAKIFKEYSFKTIFSTPFRKGILTLQPLTDQTKQKLTYYDQADIKALHKKMENAWPASCIIIIHKETFPLILKKYLKQAFTENISTEPSDKIYVLKRTKKQSQLFSYRYKIR